MNEKQFIKNLETNKQASCSITFLKILYYSIINDIKVSARNCERETFQMTQSIDHGQVQNWIAKLSMKYDFSYIIKNQDNKGNQIYYFVKS